MRKVFLLIATTLIAQLSLNVQAQTEPFKVAFVYVGPVGDSGWSKSHDLGREHVERVFGDRIQTNFVESVPTGRGASDTIDRLVNEGHDMVFTTSWGYMIPTDRAAQNHPNVLFEHATGIRRGDNLSTYANRAYQGRYLAGVAAGSMSKSGVIGYVAAHPVVEIIRGINAFTLGVRSVNPDAQVQVEWTRSWYDPKTERQLTNTLINQGADVIAQHTDSPAPIQTAERRGVYSIGYHTDMSRFAPEHHLLSIVHDWGAVYEQRIQAALDQRWQSADVWQGMDSGAVNLTQIHSQVPEAVRQRLENEQAALSAGAQKVFAGPINNHRGRTKVREGHVLSDLDLMHMDWFVEGVKGQLRTL
ncbi:BMP family ABC transporter substrate-binding protein [Bacterioplanes sanyensis]|nr:BMP family ABC transporter substrate-binding protein [Bacterioplanes sanyensis]